MAIKVLLFAQLAELMNAKELVVENISSTNELIGVLEQQYPVFKGAAYVVAVEKDIINANTKLNDFSTVALLPPFSGG
ncbi:MAG: MoaD/ThiS family protein [Flavitalea sp.]